MIWLKKMKRKSTIIKILIILFVFFSSCRALISLDKYQGLWLGNLKINGIANHQIVEIKNDRIYLYDLNRVIDSAQISKKNKIINDSQSNLGRIKLIEKAEIIQIKKNTKDDNSTDYLRKITPTQLLCKRGILDKIDEEKVEWHVIITEEGKYYCTEKIKEVKDLSKYEYSKIAILKINKTYFISNQNRKRKNVVAPILKIQNDKFEVYDDFEKEKLEIIWGSP